ncbi:MAG TPA: glycosyltransferase family 4 protein [Candidatus Limnocylindrales bacterium]|nr:glycosyltransferase family 4 protein [Candidatus Limnocylindrales bacterium]
MRIGFYSPFTGSVGGGDRYLFMMLEEAARIREAELFVLTPERPDVRLWELVGVHVGAGSFDWRPTQAGELRANSADLDLLVAIATDIPPSSGARRSVAVIQFPFRARDRGLLRVRTGAARAVPLTEAARSLAGYDRYITYSAFAQEWTRRRLGVDAEVIAPPVDRPKVDLATADRRRWIVSVGRFFRGGHEKRQDVLIDAFRALAVDGWELHLVGTADDDSLLVPLQKRASGLRTEFHVDLPRDDLLELYAQSSLFWHATGFGVDPERHPERLEHFGISTVEAMMYGVVPLVAPYGGQSEIVTDGVNGRHWTTIPELVTATRSLIDSPYDWRRLSEAAAHDALRYETSLFRTAVRTRVLTLAATEPR